MAPERENRASQFPVMENMTVMQVREYLRTRKSIIIPIGVIEQHGYHLPLCTDALIATGVAHRIGERIGMLVAPVMYESFSGGGLPGTINISPATMSMVLSDRLVSLAAQGFRNFYLLLGHGGSENSRALKDALQILLRCNPAFENVMIAMMGTWEFDPNGIGWKQSVKDGDWHAGWNETSCVMALRPDLVRTEDLELDREDLLKLQIEHPDNYQRAEKPVDDPFVVARMRQRPDIEVGVMGYPQKASAELGVRIIADIVDAASAKILELESKCVGGYKEIAFVPPPLIF